MPTNEFENLRDIILHGKRSELSVGERVYYDAYRLRLVEVMGNLFPTVKFITDEVFPSLVMAFIKAHPPHHYSVDLVGDSFWQFLKYEAQDFDFGVPNELISDIAHFELAMAICHTGNEEPMTLTLETSYPVHAVVAAVNEEKLCAPPERKPTVYAFYRQDFQVHWEII